MVRSVLHATLCHVRPAARAQPAALTGGGDEPHEGFPAGFSAHTARHDVDPAAAARMCLSPKEVAFFQEFGFICKRGLIPAADLAPWVEHMWDVAMPPCVNRADSSTFVDPERLDSWGPSATFSAEAERVGRVNRGYPAAYGPANIRWASVGGDPGYVSATCAHPNVLRMVQALLGGPIKRPHRNRGQYVHMPRSPAATSHLQPPLFGLGPHHDTQPSELFGFVYLEDVQPRSGGTCIWPTSPQRLYSTLDHEQSWGFHPNETYSQKMTETIAEVPPTEFVGCAGDVLFLHPLMLHSAGIHSAKHGSRRPRIATVMEWQRARPADQERVLWWTLNDATRASRPNMQHQEQLYSCMVQPGGEFAPAEDGRDPLSEAEHEVQLIHHHDAGPMLILMS